MSVLARAPAEAIESALTRNGSLPAWTRVRGPETGLVMVRGRAGGSGSTLIRPLAETQREQRLTRAEKAAATRVEFFSMRNMRS
jgi:alpha-D-ribose 1-methylphosphonate 5-triphosphate synthase subunit PhnG